MLKRNFIIFAFSFTVLFFQACDTQRKIPIDNELQKIFYLQKTNYQQLANEIINDGILRIKRHHTGQLEISPKLENASVVSKYDNFFRDLNIHSVNIAFQKGLEQVQEISFYHYRSGYVGGGEGKGIVCVLKEMDMRVVDNLDVYQVLDNAANPPKSGERIYSLLDDNWYLFYEYFD